jgi:hypothetical protein
MRAVAALAVVGVLAVTGCDAHPGSAAVINGSSISQSKVDNLVLAACDFTKVGRVQSGGTTPGQSMANLRHVILQDLITFEIAGEAAAHLHLTVSQAKIGEATANQSIPQSLSSSEREQLQQFFRASSVAQLQQAVIGAHLNDPTVTNADSVTNNNVAKLVSQAQKYLQTFTAKQDIVVNPQYGAWNGHTLVDASGSLSKPASQAALRWITLRRSASSSVAELPPSQVCG